MKKGIAVLSPFGKKILATVVITVIVFTVVVAGHPIKTYGTMQKISQDDGHWAVSDTKKTIDGLPAIEWKKNR